MRVVVLGAGVTGLATAYYLLRDGHEVTVVDRNDGVALETSFANGAQLSYSYVAPLAGPGVLPKIPPWLLRRDSPLRFYPTFDPQQWHWLIQFVIACNRARSDLTTRRLLELSFLSRRLLHELLEQEHIDFGHAMNGKLVVYSDHRSYDAARSMVDYQRSLGCEQSALSRDECLALEPALAATGSRLAERIVGGVHTPSEEVGDCYRFCVGLERRLARAGVRFALGTEIRRLSHAGGSITQAETGTGPISGDAFVVTLGYRSPWLLRRFGIRLPIYPIKGYSITLPVNAAAPSVSITDYKRKVVYAPLDAAGARTLRVAGMADIAGYSQRPDPARVAQLVAETQDAFPAIADYAQPAEQLQPWVGLRPATPTGMPVLGATPVRNLYVNGGQGALGFTLAMASGLVVADVIARRKSKISLEGFQLTS